MQKNLPNELIREILQPSLDVSDKMFGSVSPISPFSSPDHISASYLLCVCKSWLYVGTPFLYRVVILRSQAQANSLRRTLRKHPDLGAYIQKLRIEGGYGVAMRTILTSARNVSDLCIFMDIQDHDCVSGLCSSLMSVNPSRVIAIYPDSTWPQPPRRAPALQELEGKLRTCFRGWTKMVRLFSLLIYTKFMRTTFDLD